MKYLIIILTLLSFSACSPYNQKRNLNGKKLPERILYVTNPKSKDTLCISEKERAKKDIENGKIVFIQGAGFGFGDIRYEDELKELCEQYGLAFDFEPISCVLVKGQTEGCYSDYMDKVIFEKYGIGFKEDLHKKADSLFIAKTQTENTLVKYWDCDERPKLPNKTKRTNDYLPSITIDSPDIKEKKEEYGGWPFFDIGFIIEKDSTVSGFYINDFVPKLEENKKHEDELFELVVKHIKTNYPIWVPGKINGLSVRTNNIVRIGISKNQ